MTRTRWKAALLAALTSTGLACLSVLGAPPETDAIPSLSEAEAVQWGLERNPELAALRQQRGIAAADVVIARTYPFNPTYETRVRPDWSGLPGTVTNPVTHEHTVALEVECRGQTGYRMGVAGAALTRTDWEVAGQELTFAVRIVRAFDTVLYRSEKINLLQQSVQLNQKAEEQVRLLMKAGKLKPADLIVIGTEVQDSLAQVGPGQASLVTASEDLRRALGSVYETFRLHGKLEPPTVVPEDVDQLMQTALERRPEMHAHVAAIEEADAHLKLEIANRFGNVTVGATYEYNESSVNFLGAQFIIPLPVLNTHRGDIQRREAERARAALELRQTEIAVRQDVHAAIARLEHAVALVRRYQTQIRPALESALRDLRQLFEKGDASVDLLRVIDVQRKVLRARDGELDAIFEARQAQVDLAAALGDPGLALPPCPVPNVPK